MATEFIRLGENFFVAPQISTADVARARDQGVTLIVNNRPDAEAPGQPSSAAIAAAAAAAGVAYAHIPVDGRGVSMDQVAALGDALDQAGSGAILAFCRSGTRSTIVRAYLEAFRGRPADDIIAEAGAAGYDLSGHRRGLDALAAAGRAPR